MSKIFESAHDVLSWLIPNQEKALLSGKRDMSSEPLGSRASFQILEITDEKDQLTEFGVKVANALFSRTADQRGVQEGGATLDDLEYANLLELQNFTDQNTYIVDQTGMFWKKNERNWWNSDNGEEVLPSFFFRYGINVYHIKAQFLIKGK